MLSSRPVSTQNRWAFVKLTETALLCAHTEAREEHHLKKTKSLASALRFILFEKYLKQPRMCHLAF